MQTSQDGLDLIKSFEACRCNAYLDSAGIWTIGWGHTAGEITAGTSITQAEADRMLADDLREFERYVGYYVTVPLQQHQFDALVSFTYNVGPGTLKRSSVLEFLNRRAYAQAADALLDYDHASGVKVAGLTRRRRAERALFLSPPNSVVTIYRKFKGWRNRA